jgi:dienelactone hydrolase
VRLLADDYTKAGFYAYFPDVHNADSLPIEFLQDVEPPLPTREQMTLVQKTAATAGVGATLGPWVLKHREAVSKPIIDGFINTTRHTPGTDKVGVIGFCWGGRYAILATHEASSSKGVDAAYACHPSLVAIPADFDPIARPLSLALGTKDSLLGEKEVGQIQDCLAKKTDVPHEIRLYEGQVHGFALRGDWSDDKDKKAMDEAEEQGIEWFKKYLG